MRGGNGARRAGNAAEAFVQQLLQAEKPEALVIPAQQDCAADLMVASVIDGWCLYEVKSSKVARTALSARLTPAEQDLFNRYYPEHYRVIRVLRKPGKPKDTFEVLSRGA